MSSREFGSIAAPTRSGGDHKGGTHKGVLLALLIMAAWAMLHAWAMLAFRPAGGWGGILSGALLIAVQCWLYVGMFIVAHDAMHGTLAPASPRLNDTLGRLCLLAYAGFSFDGTRKAHRRHHDHSGTPEDPDFSPGLPHRFLPWYLQFFTRYFGWRELLWNAGVATAYVVAGIPILNVVCFMALPAILSSVQLFTFGTYLPHRPASAPFEDRHNARSNDLSTWTSLLTCFHFGYHHEHHCHPGVPWWRLPAVHRQAQLQALAEGSAIAQRARGP